jgi:hypothetical protein
MAKVNIFIKKDYLDKVGEAPLLVEYTHEGAKWRFNTNIKVNPTQLKCVFDYDTEIFKLTALAMLSPERKKRQLGHNLAIKSIQEKLSRIIEDCKSLSITPFPEVIEKEYLKAEKVTDTKSKTIGQWYIEFIKCKESEIGSGINSYRSTWRHFQKFNIRNRIVLLQDISKTLLDEFREYIKLQGIEGSGVHKHFKNLRVFLNWVDAENDDVEIPSCYKKLKVKARYGDPIGLTVDQFLQFYNINLSGHPELERTRDLMIFGVSIGGPRHGDLQKMSESFRKHGFNLSQGVITYFERKTGNAHKEILVNKFGLEILKKYPLFPYVPSNQRMNTNLKSIAQKLEWNEIKFLPRYNEYGKLIDVEEVALKDIFSTKFMRKTAATIDNFLGIPVKTSMSRTGHKTFAAYSRYVDVNKESMDLANNKWDEMFAKAGNRITTDSVEPDVS